MIFPEKYTPHIENLIKKSKKIERQFIYNSKEKKKSINYVDDPLCDDKFKVTKFLVHHYNDKALFLTSPICFSNCRHCFRKNILHHNDFPKEADFLLARDYIFKSGEIRELLFSGGEPLTYSNVELDKILNYFYGQNIIFRICTRAPIVEPDRVDDELLKILAKYSCRFSVHINCCDELTDNVVEKLKNIRDAGFEILTQTVLLKKINDSYKELKNLFLLFNELDLTPYYLFQTDNAKGTTHFKVSLKRGIKIYRKLKKLKYQIPKFAIDLPNGEGKVEILIDGKINKKLSKYMLKS